MVDTLATTIWVILNSTSFENAISLTQTLPGESERIMPLVGSLAGILYHQEFLERYSTNDKELAIVMDVLHIANKSHNFN